MRNCAAATERERKFHEAELKYHVVACRAEMRSKGKPTFLLRVLDPSPRRQCILRATVTLMQRVILSVQSLSATPAASQLKTQASQSSCWLMNDLGRYTALRQSHTWHIGNAFWWLQGNEQQEMTGLFTYLFLERRICVSTHLL